MSPHVARPLRGASLAVLAMTVLTGCEVPQFQGPQIQKPPPAFTMNADTYQERRMFPELRPVHHDAWVEASWGNFSGIYINGHSGVIGRDQVAAAREAAMRAAAEALADFGELESLVIDGRTAWGWGEEWRLANGGLEYVVFRAVVPYDTVSYAIDFVTGEPGLKSRPDSLRTIVASFAVGRTTVDLPVLAISAGLMLLALNMLRSRAKARADATRRMTLVKMPAPPGEETEADLSEGSVAGAIARKLNAPSG